MALMYIYLKIRGFNPYKASKPYVVGTQKSRLNETILLSTHIIGLGGILREIMLVKQLYTLPYLDLRTIRIFFFMFTASLQLQPRRLCR